MSTSSVSESVAAHRNPALSFFGLTVALTLLFLAYLVYLFIAQMSAKKEAETYQQETKTLQQQVAVLEAKKVNSLQQAKGVLDRIDNQRIYWSKVVYDALLILPKDPKTGAARTEFLSYSGSSDGKLIMSAKTIAGSENPYGDVADVVSAFSKSTTFRNVFVPTISKNQNDLGQTVLTYVLNLTYHGN